MNTEPQACTPELRVRQPWRGKVLHTYSISGGDMCHSFATVRLSNGFVACQLPISGEDIATGDVIEWKITRVLVPKAT